MPAIALNMSIRGQLLSGVRFNPAYLFSSSEPGVWYDPSDLTTLFQDAAGTTPVTAAGQPVGRILDKSGRGNHATQATAASRPTYGIVPRTGRRNLLTFSEGFNTVPSWSFAGVSISADTSTSPVGTITADTMTASAGTSVHRIISAVTTVASGVNCVHSVYLKAGTHSFAQIHDGASASYFANFNLATGVVGTATGCTATMTPVGIGWYRCSIAMTLNVANPILCVGLVTSDTAVRNESWASNGTETILLWGAQLETGSSATAYQRVTTAFDVTEVGVQSLSYLSFDGIDDFLVTPTITPNIDKVQVFAGVRKLSDAAQGCLIELGVSATDGSISLWSPPYANGGFAFWSKGTALSSNAFTATPLSPVTRVIAGLGEISTDAAVLRLNGVQSATSSQDQGTGNYLAYPIFIGRRGGTTFPLNGLLYGLIVRFGANLDANTITNTEAWVNSKTGAY